MLQFFLKTSIPRIKREKENGIKFSQARCENIVTSAAKAGEKDGFIPFETIFPLTQENFPSESKG
jgi:hypothetical protein